MGTRSSVSTRFRAENLLMTAGVEDLGVNGVCSTRDPYLQRHLNGDWGDLCATNKAAERCAVEVRRGRCSRPTGHAPTEASGSSTEWDRSVTRLLLPEEY